MPLTDIIAHFSTAAADGTPAGYPVTRRAQGSYGSAGAFIPGSTSAFTIDACIVPFDGRERITLPNGVHTHDVRVIDTATELRCEPPDIITIRGEAFAVFAVEGPVQMSGSTRWTAYASRQVIP